MERKKHYVVQATPVPWARAGINKTRFYDSQAQEKLLFRVAVEQQHARCALFNNPISVDITFYMPYPLVLRKKRNYEFHSIRPDLDNLIKFLLDAIKGIVIVDDRIIYSLKAEKVYDETPRTEFIITEGKFEEHNVRNF